MAVGAPKIARAIPGGSRLASLQADAYYSESYEAPLRRSDLKMHEIYLAILGHLPWWGRALIVVRNHIVSPFGLHAEARDAATVRRSAETRNLKFGPRTWD